MAPIVPTTSGGSKTPFSILSLLIYLWTSQIHSYFGTHISDTFIGHTFGPIYRWTLSVLITFPRGLQAQREAERAAAKQAAREASDKAEQERKAKEKQTAKTLRAYEIAKSKAAAADKKAKKEREKRMAAALPCQQEGEKENVAGPSTLSGLKRKRAVPKLAARVPDSGPKDDPPSPNNGDNDDDNGN
ncbi:hypothetical protein BDP27DRAFT_1424097 [Rhodocollybia butyracea]|uniref:Uncharacterized protein n=1 Tax=Rhodocollybia butyracea TaxID=206335 RepID=A0A9P5PN07_9AGAR|nr:hypothetical protein BDP27DRAFT_1424097 [Rhodocollybia butyracea]